MPNEREDYQLSIGLDASAVGEGLDQLTSLTGQIEAIVNQTALGSLTAFRGKGAELGRAVVAGFRQELTGPTDLARNILTQLDIDPSKIERQAERYVGALERIRRIARESGIPVANSPQIETGSTILGLKALENQAGRAHRQLLDVNAQMRLLGSQIRNLSGISVPTGPVYRKDAQGNYQLTQASQRAAQALGTTPAITTNARGQVDQGAARAQLAAAQSAQLAAAQSQVQLLRVERSALANGQVPRAPAAITAEPGLAAAQANMRAAQVNAQAAAMQLRAAQAMERAFERVVNRAEQSARGSSTGLALGGAVDPRTGRVTAQPAIDFTPEGRTVFRQPGFQIPSRDVVSSADVMRDLRGPTQADIRAGRAVYEEALSSLHAQAVQGLRMGVAVTGGDLTETNGNLFSREVWQAKGARSTAGMTAEQQKMRRMEEEDFFHPNPARRVTNPRYMSDEFQRFLSDNPLPIWQRDAYGKQGFGSMTGRESIPESMLPIPLPSRDMLEAQRQALENFGPGRAELERQRRLARSQVALRDAATGLNLVPGMGTTVPAPPMQLQVIRGAEAELLRQGAAIRQMRAITGGGALALPPAARDMDPRNWPGNDWRARPPAARDADQALWPTERSLAAQLQRERDFPTARRPLTSDLPGAGPSQATAGGGSGNALADRIFASTGRDIDLTAAALKQLGFSMAEAKKMATEAAAAQDKLAGAESKVAAGAGGAGGGRKPPAAGGAVPFDSNDKSRREGESMAEWSARVGRPFGDTRSAEQRQAISDDAGLRGFNTRVGRENVRAEFVDPADSAKIEEQMRVAEARAQRARDQAARRENLHQFQQSDAAPDQKFFATLRGAPPGQPGSFKDEFRLGFMGASDRGLGEQLGQTAKFSLFYGAAYKALFLLSQGFGIAAQSAIDFEAGLTDLNIVTEQGRASNEKYADSLSEIGSNMGLAPGATLAAGVKSIGLFDLTDLPQDEQRRQATNLTTVAARIGSLSKVDVGVAETQLAGTMRAFELPNDDASRIEDIISYIGRRSGQQPTDVLQSMSLIGNLAGNAGYTPEETGAIVARLATSTGQTPTTAAGAFRQILTKADDPAAMAALRALGVNTEGTTMAQQMHQLSQLDLTQAQKNQVIQKFGRGNAGQAMGIILDQMPEIQKLTEGAKGATGEGERDFNLSMQNIGAQLRILGGHVQQLLKDLATSGLLDLLAGLVKVLDLAVQAADFFVDTFNLIPHSLRTAAFAVAELTAALVLLSRMGVPVSGVIAGILNVMQGSVGKGALSGAGARYAAGRGAALAGAEAAGAASAAAGRGSGLAGLLRRLLPRAGAPVAGAAAETVAATTAATTAAQAASRTAAQAAAAATAVPVFTSAAQAAAQRRAIDAAVRPPIPTQAVGSAAEAAAIRQATRSAATAGTTAAATTVAGAEAARRIAATAAARTAATAATASAAPAAAAAGVQTVRQMLGAAAPAAAGGSAAAGGIGAAMRGLMPAITSGLGSAFKVLTGPVGWALALAGGGISAVSQDRAAARTFGSAQRTAMGASTVEDLRAAASQERAAQKESQKQQDFFSFRSILTLGIAPLYNKLGFSGSSNRVDQARQARTDLERQATALETAQAEAQKLSPETSFGSFSTTDAVATGLQKLSEQGFSATEKINLLNKAFDSFILKAGAAAGTTGVIFQGQGAEFAARLGGAGGGAVKSVLDDLRLRQNSDVTTSQAGFGTKLLSALGDIMTGGNVLGADTTGQRGAARQAGEIADMLEGKDIPKLQEKVGQRALLTLVGRGKDPSKGLVNLTEADTTALQAATAKELEGQIGPETWAKMGPEWQKRLTQAFITSFRSTLKDFGGNPTNAVEMQGFLAGIQQEAGNAGAETTLRTGDSLAGAKATEDALRGGSARARAGLAGIKDPQERADAQRFIEQNELKILEAQRKTVESQNARIQSLLALQNAHLGLDDKVGRGRNALAALHKQRDVAVDVDEQNRLDAQILEQQQQNAIDAVNATNVNRQAGIDPRAVRARMDDQLRGLKNMAKLLTEGSEAMGQNLDQQAQIIMSQRNYDLDTKALNAQIVAGPNDSRAQAIAAVSDTQRRLKDAIAGGDPNAIRQASLAHDRARFAKMQSDQDANAAARAANLAPGDSVKAARNAVDDAKDQMMLYNKDTIEYNRALAQYHQAQQGLSDAMLAQKAQLGQLSIDMTNPVQQAQQALRDAQAKLKAADTPDERNAAQIDIRNAQASAEGAAFSQRLQDVQFAENMGRISHAAYLQYLQGEHNRLTSRIAGMKQTDNGYRQAIDELQQIDSTMKEAADQLQGQFNLGDIKVPTVYEVRRAMSPNADMASSLADYSTTTVNINGADFAAVVQYIQKYLGGPAATVRTSSPRKV